MSPLAAMQAALEDARAAYAAYEAARDAMHAAYAAGGGA